MEPLPKGSVPLGLMETRLEEGVDRPTVMPHMAPGQLLVCAFARFYNIPPEAIEYYVIGTVEDMQRLYDACSKGFAVEITWNIWVPVDVDILIIE